MHSPTMPRCGATTLAGVHCKNNASDSATTCRVHAPTAKRGVLYVLSNPSLDVLKIGWTSGSVQKRAATLDSTGVPTPFVVEHESAAVDDAPAAERRVFDALADRRVNARREFFRVTVAEATSAVDTATGPVRAAATLSASLPPTVVVEVPCGDGVVGLDLDKLVVRFARGAVISEGCVYVRHQATA